MSVKIVNVKSGSGFKRPPPRGFVLLDAVIAILVFSIGIVGMVALQGTAVKLASDSLNRSNAAMLADQVIAQMWGGDLTASTFTTKYTGSAGSGGTGYTAWAATLDCTSTTKSTSCLPGVAANPPTIAITQTLSPQVPPSGTTPPVFLVTVTVNWKAPNDNNAHSYVSITQFSR
jgi:type IV pilus assembly protein PilV